MLGPKSRSQNMARRMNITVSTAMMRTNLGMLKIRYGFALGVLLGQLLGYFIYDGLGLDL